MKPEASPRTALHEAALAYAAAGLAVFALAPGSKEPRKGSASFKDATTDAAQINAWWTATPDANIGTEPGRAGLVVVDIDDKNGHRGSATWSQLSAELAIDNDTYTTGTPSGGTHKWFVGHLPPSASRLGDGLDVRGDSSYVLLPPSVLTEYGGAPYTLIRDTPPKPLPAGIAERLRVREHAARAAAVEDIDAPHHIERAREHLRLLVSRGDVAIEGSGGDDRTYRLACEVMDLGVSPEAALDLIDEIWNPHCQPPWDRDELEVKIANAVRYRENDIGSEAVERASEAFSTVSAEVAGIIAASKGKIDPVEAKRQDAKFMMMAEGVDATPRLNTVSLCDLIYSLSPAPSRRDLVPEFVGAGFFIPLRGNPGNHKSRMTLQLFLAKLYDRELFSELNTRIDTVWSARTPCGGIPVAHFEVLSYEDDKNEVHRRIEMMKPGFRVPARAGGDDDPTGRCEFHFPDEPILKVDGSGKPELTPLGRVMLGRWEKLSETADGHLLIWLDSFWDAVDMAESARTDDTIARRVITILNHWCRVLDATIIAPYHASRAGQANQHSGYAPAFDSKPRQVLTITAKLENVRNGEQNEKRQTGMFTFSIPKWTGGPQGKRLDFRFEKGQLVACDTTVSQVSADTMMVATELVLTHTYRGREREFQAGMPLAERDNLERQFKDYRLRRNGQGWQVVEAGQANKLTTDHWIIDDFRRRTGNRNATVADFIGACERAQKAGYLGYRDADRSVKSDKRLPTGYHVVAYQPSAEEP